VPLHIKVHKHAGMTLSGWQCSMLQALVEWLHMGFCPGSGECRHLCSYASVILSVSRNHLWGSASSAPWSCSSWLAACTGALTDYYYYYYARWWCGCTVCQGGGASACHYGILEMQAGCWGPRSLVPNRSVSGTWWTLTDTHPKAVPLACRACAGVGGEASLSTELWVGAVGISSTCIRLAFLPRVNDSHMPLGPAVACVLVGVVIRPVVAWVGAFTALGAVSIMVLRLLMVPAGWWGRLVGGGGADKGERQGCKVQWVYMGRCPHWLWGCLHHGPQAPHGACEVPRGGNKGEKQGGKVQWVCLGRRWGRVGGSVRACVCCTRETTK
jgi:hypothetical protein